MIVKRVYRFGCRVLSGIETIDAQMVAAHRYGNDLVAIERGRRWALRQIDDTPEVRAAIELVEASTKSTRKEAFAALRAARKEARLGAAAELERIAVLDAQIRRDARALTEAWWGNYLTIEASAQQQRSMPLYSIDDGFTPSDPHFARWDGDSQVGVQIQGGLTTDEVIGCSDMRVRLHLGVEHRRWRESVLWMRLGSGEPLSPGGHRREPIWATIGVRLDRMIPANARWKWVRLSRRRNGPIDCTSLVSRRKGDGSWPTPLERWSVEITVELPSLEAAYPRELDTSLCGAIAVEPTWEKSDQGLRIAYWRDHEGKSGELVLPASDGRLAKADAIRSTRDVITNAMKEALQRALVEAAAEALPRFLVETRGTVHLWRSAARLHSLARRWAREAPNIASSARKILEAWRVRDDHLWRYESGIRGGALRARRELYRVTARRWAMTYRVCIVPKRDYSRLARFGADAELRHAAAPGDFISALEGAFSGGFDLWSATWSRPDAEQPSWLETAIGRWRSGDPTVGATKDRVLVEAKPKGGAWAARKAAKLSKEMSNKDSAREPDDKCAE